MSKAIKAVLLSGLVFPGVGQLALGLRRRGWTFLLIGLASFGVVVAEVVKQVNASLAQLDLNQLGDAQAIAHSVEQTGSSTLYSLALLVLGLCWLVSLIDAFLCGRRLDQR